MCTPSFASVSEVLKSEKVKQSTSEAKDKLADTEGIVNTKDIVITNLPQDLNPIIYRYDETGFNKGVVDSQGNETTFEYDSKGRIKKSIVKDKDNSILFTTTYKYDNTSLRMRRLTTKDVNGIVLLDYSYKYDKNENATLEKNNVTNTYREFVYGNKDELLEENYYGKNKNEFVKSISYTYDESGNRVQKTVEEGNSTRNIDYGYDEKNQIASMNNEQIHSYDSDGNILYNGKNTNVYNGKNQITKVQVDNGVVETYTYNDNGLRTKKVSNGESKIYNYSGEDVFWIGDEGNDLNYLFSRNENGKLLSMTDYTGKKPITYWYLFDGFGNVVGLVDKNSTNVIRYEYDAWGNISNTTGNIILGNGKPLQEENPFRYVGYQYDNNTGYYFLNARYYDSKTGRFMSLDPYKEHKEDPISQNLYVYCGNNPIKYYDPSGNMYLAKNSSANDKNDVITLQCKLQMINKPNTSSPYYSGSVDGIFGSMTETAVKQFQQDNNLYVDGIVGNATWNKLKTYIAGDFILAQGSASINVTTLQQELERRGLLTISTDPNTGYKNYGYFGPKTEAAVNAYKESVGLWNTGVYWGRVGATTWEHLFSHGTSKFGIGRFDYLIYTEDVKEKISKYAQIKQEANDNYNNGLISYSQMQIIEEQAGLEADTLRADYIVTNPYTDYGFAVLGGDRATGNPFSRVLSYVAGNQKLGIDVLVIQRVLELYEDFELPPTQEYGTYGPVTEEGVIKFQDRIMGDSDGIVGPNTVWSLFSAGNANSRTWWAMTMLREYTAQHKLVQITTAEKLFASAIPGQNIEVTIKGGGPKGGNGYADILNKITGQVWEVKRDSAYGRSTGPKQIQRYITASIGILQNPGIKTPLIVGYTISPYSIPYKNEQVINVRGGVQWVDGPEVEQSGMVYYKAVSQQQQEQEVNQPSTNQIMALDSEIEVEYTTIPTGKIITGIGIVGGIVICILLAPKTGGLSLVPLCAI